MKREINTPLFRLALSASIIWVLIFAYFAKQEYRSIEPFMFSQGYSEAVAECSAYQTDMKSTGEFFSRPPTTAEIEDCRSFANKIHSGYERDEEKRVFWQAIKRTLLPPIILLFLAAYWRVILSGISQVVNAYLASVRGAKAD